MQQKLPMVAHLWRVADLLHVPKGGYVHARLRARPSAPTH